MKKYISLVLIICLLFTFTSCNSNDEWNEKSAKKEIKSISETFMNNFSQLTISNFVSDADELITYKAYFDAIDKAFGKMSYKIKSISINEDKSALVNIDIKYCDLATPIKNMNSYAVDIQNENSNATSEVIESKVFERLASDFEKASIITTTIELKLVYSDSDNEYHLNDDAEYNSNINKTLTSIFFGGIQ